MLFYENGENETKWFYAIEIQLILLIYYVGRDQRWFLPP
jgi:hypothetical protein